VLCNCTSLSQNACEGQALKLLYIGVCTHVRARTRTCMYIYIIRTYIHLHIHITLYKTYVHTFLYYGIRSILGANLFMNRGVQQTHLQLQLGTLTLIRSKYKEN
jgi:hypothetical protein